MKLGTRILIFGGWGAVVFLGVFLLTFPSGAVTDRLSWEVSERTNGDYELEVASARPWWFGLSLDNVIASTKVAGDTTGLLAPFFFGENVSARVGLFSLLARKPVVTASVAVGDGLLDAVVSTDPRGEQKVTAIVLDGEGLPLEDLIAAATAGREAALSVTGGLDLDVDLDAAEGLATATGDFSLSGADLTLDTLSLPQMGWVDKEMNTTIEELDLRVQFDDGEGDISRAVLMSSLAELEIEGSVQLSDRVERSEVDLEVTLRLGDWGDTPLASFQSMAESFLKAAEGSDGAYHYTVSTTLSRLDFSDFRPVRSRTVTRTATPATTTTPQRPEIDLDQINADAEKRREEIEARRQEREEAAAKAREEAERRKEELEDLGYEDDEDGFEDEEVDDEEFTDEEGIGDDFEDDY